jgi:hypothetical protein
VRGYYYFDAKPNEANPLSIQSMDDDGIVADFLIETVANHIAAQHFSFQAHQSSCILDRLPSSTAEWKYHDTVVSLVSRTGDPYGKFERVTSTLLDCVIPLLQLHDVTFAWLIEGFDNPP